MRALARRPQLPEPLDAVDIVGTGGDRSGSLNLSTGAALLAAACGLPVVKHGNRAISSRAGSADVLQALGLPLPLDEAAAGRCFAALGFTFLFAPYYHAATKNIAPVRAALGVRTVFNLLGPLCNPAAPPYLVIGAFSRATAELMAHALIGSGIRRAFVIHGAEGWDEPTPIGGFTLFDVGADGVRCEQRTPADYGLPLCEAGALAGADAAHNALELKRGTRRPRCRRAPRCAAARRRAGARGHRPRDLAHAGGGARGAGDRRRRGRRRCCRAWNVSVRMKNCAGASSA